MTLIRWSSAARAAARAVPRTLLPLAAALAAGCGDGELISVDPSPVVDVTPRAITAVPGDTVRLRLTGDRGRSVRPTVLGSSTAAARVDTAGLVTAVAPGTAVVTATVVSNGVTVSVSVPVTVLGITLSPATATIASPGGWLTLRPTFVGDSAAYGTLRWTSSDTTVAVVGADGTVRGVRSGVVRITTTSSADPRLRAEAQVTAACGCGWGSLSVQPTTVTLQPGATQQLEASVTLEPGAPAGTSRGVLYSSSDTTVATISATGLITGRRNGTAVVTVAMAAAPTVTQAVAVTVRDPGRGRLTIQSVTTGDPPVPAELRAVRGRIRVTMNVLPEIGVVRRAELWLAGRRAAVRDSIPPATGNVITLTLEVDTDARDSQTNARLYPNGETTLEVRLEFTPPGATTVQTATVPLALTLANP